MKITDVTSASNNNNPLSASRVQDEEEGKVLKEDETIRKKTLLQRFEIPIEHLDFDYVKKCIDSREIERILRILRSGEEGTYPDLERCVEARLENLNPNSRLLRVEKPAVRTQELDSAEREAIQSGLQEWLENVTSKSSSMYQSKLKKSTEIFTEDEQGESMDPLKDFPLPVRGSITNTKVELNNKPVTPAVKKNNGTRIKSWEYDKWDKYDVDTELTKMDIFDMQREEWENREKPKIMQEQKKIERLMKNSNVDENTDKPKDGNTVNQRPNQSLTTKPAIPAKQKTKSGGMPVDKPSFIEEVNDEDDDEAGVTVNSSTFFRDNGKRKATVIIEDLNLPM